MGSLTIVAAKNAKPGRHADGEGLYLLVKPTGARSWLLRIQQHGRRRDIGLGSFSIIGLAEAREKARELRRAAYHGRDPILERDKDRKPVPTFEDATRACHTDFESGWAPKNAASFLSSLEDHAFPTIGRMRVDTIDSAQLRDMLAPIWTVKPEMARKVRQRASIVLNYAKSKGWRDTEAPGKSVTMGLARHAAGGNFAAMPYSDVPAFVAAQAAKVDTAGRLALLFLLYTAARSGEVRHARWEHIDRDKRLWNRPADLMKGKVAHAVTLTGAALSILDRAAVLSGKTAGLIFPSSKATPLSDMTLSKIMRDGKLPYTPHGFRSSFRDFAAEQMPTIPDPVAEAALAHVVPDKVERACKRTAFLEMRRKLLDGWADHLEGRSNVLRLAVPA